MKTYMVKRAFIIIIIIIILCVFCFYFVFIFTFILFFILKKSKYVALDFSADFLIFNFNFVSSFLLI
jgi:hypothetical protein